MFLMLVIMEIITRTLVTGQLMASMHAGVCSNERPGYEGGKFSIRAFVVGSVNMSRKFFFSFVFFFSQHTQVQGNSKSCGGGPR